MVQSTSLPLRRMTRMVPSALFSSMLDAAALICLLSIYRVAAGRVAAAEPPLAST